MRAQRLMGSGSRLPLVRCRACARVLERLSVARRCSALRSACRLAQACGLVSAFPSYLAFPAGDVVEAAYDVLFSQLLAF